MATEITKNIFSIPNIISFIRIIIVIFAAIELINYNNFNSFILYLSAAITDVIDGFLARRLNQITALGKIIDPIADKLMISSAIIILAFQSRIPIWYVLLFIIGSLINLLGGLFLIKKFNFVPSAV
jgi:cardiolipin synthase